MRRIGIDVGGTNTDAVLLEDGRVVHAVKTPTTTDVTAGILTALAELAGHSEARRGVIDGAVIGTTHFVNAVVLTAARGDLARRTVAGFTQAIAASGITAPLYLTQNDGTVMSAATATALPVMSFASGATNSMRGAAFLSGLADAMVIDVGGTSTDVGQLRRGFPREANSVVEVGGVRTLFRMPDLLSIALGGGSIVERHPLAVGPKSVGYRLTRDAVVFGGSTLTATDAAVAAGLAEIGEAS